MEENGMDPYKEALFYETKRFCLRPVRVGDAQDLLRCYGDPVARARMNADFCTNDFCYETAEPMRAAIAFWQTEYAQRMYARLAVIEKVHGEAVGTMEISGGDTSVWRLDLADAFETAETVEELLALTVFEIARDFQAKRLYVKAVNTPERQAVFLKYGFSPCEAFRPGMGYWARPAARSVERAKGVAACALACCACGENDACAGCKMHGCDQADTCRMRSCCGERQIEGCWACGAFPCGEEMLAKRRVRAFARFLARYGEEALMQALDTQAKAGICYHYPGRLTGDYDCMQSEAEIVAYLARDCAGSGKNAS
jgi:hypothetical protein